MKVEWEKKICPSQQAAQKHSIVVNTDFIKLWISRLIYFTSEIIIQPKKYECLKTKQILKLMFEKLNIRTTE